MHKSLLFLVPILAFCISCGSKSSGKPGDHKDSVATETKAVFRVDTFHVAENQEGNCGEAGCAGIDMHYAYIHAPSDAAQDSVNAFARKLIDLFFEGEGGGGPHASADVQKAAKEFIQSYVEFSKEESFGSAWEADFDLSIDHPFNELYTITCSYWTYTGGAHGNGFTGYYILSATSGRLLKLDDLFTDVKKLTAIGEKYFREQNMNGDQADLSESGFEFDDDGFYLNENFLLTPDGLLFLYNSYEIAPYAAGTQEIDIPMEKIKGLLKIRLTVVEE